MSKFLTARRRLLEAAYTFGQAHDAFKLAQEKFIEEVASFSGTPKEQTGDESPEIESVKP